jgi:nucleotide-binding universal stress UspA family protein
VVGRKKRTGIKDAFVGTATTELLRRSPVPVLVSKYMVEFEWNDEVVTRVNDRIFEKPLIATDWSSPAEKALELIASLRSVVRKAAVCHIIDDRKSEKAELQRIEGERTAELRKCCESLENAGIEAEFHLAAGHRVEEILQIARASHASMIVTGTTGKDRLHELWSKSTSHGIANKSELPTLLVQG